MYVTDIEKNYCSCMAWKYQKIHPNQRTCKHLDNVRTTEIKKLGVKQSAPKLMLFSSSIANVSPGWVWSEKYDGIRVLWTGSELISRGGITLGGHPWKLPNNVKLDGELWSRSKGRIGAMDALIWDFG